MPRKECIIIRDFSVFRDPKTKQIIKEFKSINEAKKASRLIQQKDGYLGDGRVRVAKDKEDWFPST